MTREWRIPLALILGLGLGLLTTTARAAAKAAARAAGGEAQTEQLVRDGKTKEAEKAARAAVAEDVKLHGPDHVSTLSDRLLLARVQQAAGDPIAAEKECRAVLATFTSKLGADN